MAPLPISCFLLPAAELQRRTELAEERAEALCVAHDRPEGRYGREILWHSLFGAEFVALLSDMPLPESRAWLAADLAGYAHEGQPLDLLDYAYLADILREGLADHPAPLVTLRLRRALAWVKQAGGQLLTASAPTPTQAVAGAVPSPYSADEAAKAVLACASADALTALWPHLQAYEADELVSLALAASTVRWAAPAYRSPEQAEREVASRAQRDFAHKLLASQQNDAYRLEALHLLADAGLSWAACSRVVDTAKAHVDRPAPLRPEQLPAPVLPAGIAGAPVYATPAQREEIIRLLNHPVITRQEKTKMLLNINRLDEQRATQAIAKLRKAIAERPSTTALAA
ncbi:hypothetical protein [Hymenobacter baengnokdamensis]|uniref:hypothetical protein n=1 Tax=Hymenobacter baengnokdamensis TaxID=2615203 RepID=UPI001E5DD97A|nr:hypothetical protein [Hymenobacter baengnokdamensis]